MSGEIAASRPSTGDKEAARVIAQGARAAAHAAGAGAPRRMAAHVLGEIARTGPVGIVAAYHAFRTEIDTRPAMLGLHGLGIRTCLPVVIAKGQPLRFRAWHPGAALVRGAYGVDVPAEGAWLEPDLLLVPLLAFDASCNRLGYGGGFYDRTLAALRAERDVAAWGIAYAAQRMERLPVGPTDAPLDAVITEAGVHRPA